MCIHVARKIKSSNSCVCLYMCERVGERNYMQICIPIQMYSKINQFRYNIYIYIYTNSLYIEFYIIFLLFYIFLIVFN